MSYLWAYFIVNVYCVSIFSHFQDAVDMFSLAIKYNPTVSQYYENRSKAFRKLCNLKGASEDFICMLILDHNSKEVKTSFQPSNLLILPYF